jgi:uncharacterized protein
LKTASRARSIVSPEEIEQLALASAPKLELMRRQISECGSALIAFSGGVDSTLVLKIAADVLGPKAVALTAVSPSLSAEEELEASRLALSLHVRHEVVHSNELSNPRYVENAPNRCYFCKTELYDLCDEKRRHLGLAAILDGFNSDDFRDHRPGHSAAREHGVLSPLADAGLGKDEIRAWSFKLELPTWDKPQLACLASRIPYGTGVTPERLALIGAAESELRRMGLRNFRIRYHGQVARIEVSEEEYGQFHSADFRRQVNLALKSSGFPFVALDLEPFRSGRMNDGLERHGSSGDRSAADRSAGSVR